MIQQLIINADDFGLTEGINRTVVDLHHAGALSSATLMANGPAAEDAISLARRNPGLGVGCHIVLTDGTPLSDPGRIPSLLGPDRRLFRRKLSSFAAAALLGRLNPRELELEIEAQVSRLLTAGLLVTHLDTHKHTHLFPVVLDPLLRVAERLGIPAVRNPFEPEVTTLRHGSRTRQLQLRLLARLRARFHRRLAVSSIGSPDGTLGISATGNLRPGSLQELLDNLPPGTWELVCHPGTNDADLDKIATRLREHREVERDALASIVPAWLNDHPDAALIHFGDLASGNTAQHPLATAMEVR